MTEQKRAFVENRGKFGLFFHAYDIMRNQGMQVSINGRDSSYVKATPLVRHITEDTNQLIWVVELRGGAGFSIRVFEGDAKDPKVLYSIHRIGCFDASGEIVNEDEAKKVSELLGFIGKSLSRDLSTNP